MNMSLTYQESAGGQNTSRSLNTARMLRSAQQQTSSLVNVKVFLDKDRTRLLKAFDGIKSGETLEFGVNDARGLSELPDYIWVQVENAQGFRASLSPVVEQIPSGCGMVVGKPIGNFSVNSFCWYLHLTLTNYIYAF